METGRMAAPDLLPDYLTPSVACRILHCTSAFLVDAIGKGVLSLLPCAQLRQKISRADVERLLERDLTAEDLLAAWKAGEPRRKANARHYLKRRDRELGEARR
jgi:hypothetical protein